MGFCFLCDKKLFGENTPMSSSITTPHSNVPYPEKIAEVLGEEFVLILTAADYICKNCTSLLTYMDKLENDLKQVKTTILSLIKKKYGTPSANQPVEACNVINGHLKTVELDIGQKKVPSGLNLTNNSVSSPLKMSKPLLENTSKMKIFKCSFCPFQSKELSNVRFHMRNHLQDGSGEKPNQTATKTPVALQQQQNKQLLYRCQVCSASYDSKLNCLDHIRKVHKHNQQTPANEGKYIETVFPRSTTKAFKPVKRLRSIGIQQTMSATCVNGQNQNKGLVNTGMLLNDNMSTGRTVVEKKDETTNAEIEMPAEEAMQVGQDSIDNIVMEAVGDLALCCEETKQEDLDIESMLAPINNDSII